MKRQRKKHTYGPGDVINTSWALFLLLFPGPIILPLCLLSIIVGYQHLQSTLQAVARRAGGRCWVERCRFCRQAVLALVLLVVLSLYPCCCCHPSHVTAPESGKTCNCGLLQAQELMMMTTLRRHHHCQGQDSSGSQARWQQQQQRG